MAPSGTRAPAPRALRLGLLPKFLITLSLLVAVLSAGLSTSFLRVTSARLHADLEARGNFLVRSLAKTGRYGVFTSFPDILAPIAAGAFEAGDVVFVEIVDLEGRPLVTRTAEGFDEERLTPLTRDVLRRLSTAAPQAGLLDIPGSPVREFLYPVILERPGADAEEVVLEHAAPGPRAVTFERIGAVRVGLSMSSLEETLGRVRFQVLAITLVVSAFSLVATVVLLRRIIGPVTGLAEASRRLAEGDFSFRARVRGNDEIAMLARAFNDMSGQVQSFQQGLERIVADRTEALAAKTRDMEEFVYTVSHDLKAPVVSTHGLVSLLAEEHGQALPPDARVYVERIRANAMHMERLLKDLFELSRVDRASRPREWVPLGELVQEVLLEHDAQIRESRTTVSVAPDLPRVHGHRDQLAQVLQNLIANALKFRRPGEPGRVDIGASQGDAGTTLWVKDDGIGIDPAHHEKIFGLFQRLHTEREFPGTGLGLAIVKKVVERHGGQVEVRSEHGRGAEFRLTLPATDKEGSVRDDMLGRIA